MFVIQSVSIWYAISFQIAMRFHVAKETVRKIYKRLACEGFIRMDERKHTISCYHKKEYTSYTLAYFHNCRYLYEDLLQSTSLLFSNIMQEAAKALTKKARQKILAYWMMISNIT